MPQTLELSKGIVRHNGRYLVLKKAKDVFKENIGKWESPGGKINMEEDETPKDAMLRKVKEETGLKCRILFEFPLLVFNTKRYYTVSHIFLLDALNDEVKLSNEHSDYKWITIEEAGSIDFTLPNITVIKYLELAEIYN
jgi:8-oxo-dGTP diphosphatase